MISETLEQAAARIERQERELRARLAATVAAISAFTGFRPGDEEQAGSVAGQPFALQAGQRLRESDAIALAYPERFRPLTTSEIERAVASSVRSWRYVAGL